jgi:hypothetical protein
MWPAVRPVDAGAREDPPRPFDVINVNAKFGNASATLVGQLVVPVAHETHDTGGEESVAELDSEPAGEVVIARACLSDRSLIAVLAQRTDLDARRDPGYGLQRGCDIGASQFVVPVAALGSNDYETTIDELAKVSGGGRGRDPCVARKLTGRQGPAVGQRAEHRRASGVAEQRSDRREIAVTLTNLVGFWHGHSIPRRRFTSRRNVSALP